MVVVEVRAEALVAVGALLGLLLVPVVPLEALVPPVAVRAPLGPAAKLLHAHPAEVELALLTGDVVAATDLGNADAAAGAGSAVVLQIAFGQAVGAGQVHPAGAHEAGGGPVILLLAAEAEQAPAEALHCLVPLPVRFQELHCILASWLWAPLASVVCIHKAISKSALVLPLGGRVVEKVEDSALVEEGSAAAAVLVAADASNGLDLLLDGDREVFAPALVAETVAARRGEPRAAACLHAYSALPLFLWPSIVSTDCRGGALLSHVAPRHASLSADALAALLEPPRQQGLCVPSEAVQEAPGGAYRERGQHALHLLRRILLRAMIALGVRHSKCRPILAALSPPAGDPVKSAPSLLAQ
eukprot:CAMPEP_0114607474 /NCGR_PEP_ID=MMETSP0168-20121206/2087_1 /TAXON_ID=95228 ORGANISM="Vannella sp., Strain DIVA3 517/6/12" /NCGR_SAMPLE_ID=MMETSP0168 /ASSEMBLY_ACC=CAM_ASM_000044 /LENGTH=357 /DNA_ID=CAMNT_0001818353 /DNA_START=530 /DNA_END=1604 /DNA_ORIENTATION=-